MRLTGIVLAAGKSSRMGRDKLSIVMPDGRCLAAWTLEAALNSDLEKVICVVKPEDSLAWIPSIWLNAASYGGNLDMRTKLQIAICTDYAYGMAMSLHCGILSAMAYRPEGVMMILADQPLLQARDINRVAESLAANKRCDYAAATDGSGGKPPVVFREHMLGPLLSLSGDEGARKIIRNAKYTGTHVSLSDFSFWDADTEPELERILDYVNGIR
ncbi:nucleotidyltransferase family protein [Paenibacillus taichungensis]|uniref:nucleotidyltransferase family protein n=1 Tax=Paenibacillus taichungensis TaxID=484184 RepID=UPI0028727B6A|nr:nucleotidyltransferase family protein [Paenibacillus taichungensis]MDR9745936.1 nucleotidyltransferase family protein [Paenibacillus taichungensis]